MDENNTKLGILPNTDAADLIDPMSAVQAQGNQKLLNQADTNIQSQYKQSVLAAQGDPEAQLAVAQNSLGAAVGSLKLPNEGRYTPSKASVNQQEIMDQIKAKKLSFFNPEDPELFESHIVDKNKVGDIRGALGLDENQVTQSIKVDPEHQGKGIASKLYKKALDEYGIIRSSDSKNQLEGGRGLWKKFEEENPYNIRQARNPKTLEPLPYKVWEADTDIPLRKKEMAIEDLIDTKRVELDEHMADSILPDEAFLNKKYTNVSERVRLAKSNLLDLAKSNNLSYDSAVNGTTGIEDIDDLAGLLNSYNKEKELINSKLSGINKENPKSSKLKKELNDLINQHKEVNKKSGHTLFNKGGMVGQSYADGGEVESPGLFQQAMGYIDNNLQNQYAQSLAAAQLDPNAQLALANQQLGMVGSVQAPSQGLGIIQKLEQKLGFVPDPKLGKLQNAEAFHKMVSDAAEQGLVNQTELAASTQRLGTRKALGFADGGEVPDMGHMLSPLTYQPIPVNVVNPEGNIVSIGHDQLDDALSEGYRVAPQAEVDHFFKDQQYGSAGQQAITGLEGAGQGIAGPLAPALEQSLGVNPADIRARQETNPGTHAVGQIAGLAGSMATGIGEGALVAKAGEAATAALGIGSKIGSTATKAAIENALISGSDETSRMVLQDPDQTVQSALVDVGLSGLIGGGAGAAIGAINPLWKAQMSGKLGGLLDGLAKRTGGIEGILPDSISDAISTTGMDISPEVKAALTADPTIQGMFQTLQESSTKAGMKAQDALKTFKGQLADHMLSAVGKTPEDLASLEHLSDFDAGTDIKKALVSSIEERVEPLSNRFTKIQKEFAGAPLSPTTMDELATKMGELSSKEGYNLSPSSPQSKLMQNVYKELPNLKSLEDLRKYQSLLGDQTYGNMELRRIGGQLKGLLRDVEESSIMQAAGSKAPELIGEHQAARAAYRNSMTQLDSLNDRLHVGKYNGPQSFVKALKDMAPEDILRRLNPKGDAGLIGELINQYPEAAQKLRDYHVSQLIKVASNHAGETAISPSKFFNITEKMSPELRDFVLPGDAQSKLKAIGTLLDALPSKLNTSGTAKTLDTIWSHLPASAAGIASMMLGHNPITGYVLGTLGKYIARDAPDALRLATLKFLGSAKPVESEAFKSMVDFTASAIKGQTLMNKAATNVFKAGREVLAESKMPSDSDRLRLDKQLKKYAADPSGLLNIGGKTGHYMPEASAAAGMTAANAVNYLNSLRPATTRPNPLDGNVRPNPVQKAAYTNALNIAEQPLVVLDKIKRGTLTSADVQTIKTIYPSLYGSLSTKLMGSLMEHTDDGELVAYKTRLGLSTFLERPLDSTMLPQNILTAQGINANPSGVEQQEPKQGPKRSTASLSKLPGQYQTSDQARSQRMQREK